MAYVTPWKLKKNSVPTTLSSGITAVAGTIPVTELSRFYDEDGVLITKGIVIGFLNADPTLAEEVTITGASGTSGAGNLTGATRGVNADGTIGAGYAWPTGTEIAVMYSTGVFNTLREDIVDGIHASVASEISALTEKSSPAATDLLIIEDSAASNVKKKIQIGNLNRSTRPFGVKWNTGSSSPALTRVDQFGTTISLATADFDNHAVWGGMKRCNLSNTGVVNAWYGDAGFSYTGSNGQVMVWVPKFWYRAEKDNSTGYITYLVSGQPLPGYKVHPAFITNGKEMAGFYIGAFQACTYDVSAKAYNTTDAAGVDTTASTGDQLASIAAAKPTSGTNNSVTLPLFRVLAQNRGSGWNLQNFNQVAAIELLYLIEYASFNSQSVLSAGVTNITDDASTNMAVNSGFTAGSGTGSSDLGNASGQVSISHYQTSQTTNPMSYRGIENFYGNIYIWVDGINIKANNNPWIADNGFASNTFAAPYVDTGLTLLASNDYTSQVAFGPKLDYGFLASTGGGSSSTYLTDYYWQATGDMAAFFGGGWNGGASAGAFAWRLSGPASYVARYVGARLCFFS